MYRKVEMTQLDVTNVLSVCVTLDLICFLVRFGSLDANKGHLWQCEVFVNPKRPSDKRQSPSEPNEICETITGPICKLCSEPRFYPAGVLCSVSLKSVSSSAVREPDDAINTSRLDVVTFCHRRYALTLWCLELGSVTKMFVVICCVKTTE